MKKIRERSLRLESLEDRMLLAVTAGGFESAAAVCAAEPLPTAAVQLETPTGLDATCAANNTLNVTWNAVTNASSYTVYYKMTTATSWRSSSPATNSVTLRGLVASSAYMLKVVANGDGVNYTNSEESDTITRMPTAGFSTVVTTLDDIAVVASPTGPISLRQAVYFASKTGNTVTFAEGLEGTIDLAPYGHIKNIAGSFGIDGDNRITVTNTASDGKGRLFLAYNYDELITSITLKNIVLTGATATTYQEFNKFSDGPEPDGAGFGSAFMLYSPYSKVDVTVDNVTITDCVGTANGTFYLFGVGNLNMTNCTICGNRTGSGGGFYLQECDNFTISDCVFDGNIANYNGGGVAIVGCTNGEINDSLITNNAAYSTSTDISPSGGGLYVDGIYKGGAYQYTVFSSLTLNNTTISGNRIDIDPEVGETFFFWDAEGGGVCIYNSNFTTNECTISDNAISHAISGAGGGVFAIYKDEYGYEYTVKNDIYRPYNGTLRFNKTYLTGNSIGTFDDFPGGVYGASGGAVWACGNLIFVDSVIADNVLYGKDTNGLVASAVYDYCHNVFNDNGDIVLMTTMFLYYTTVAGNKTYSLNGRALGDQSGAFRDYGNSYFWGSTILGNQTVDMNGTRDDASDDVVRDLDYYTFAIEENRVALPRFLSCAVNPDTMRKVENPDWVTGYIMGTYYDDAEFTVLSAGQSKDGGAYLKDDSVYVSDYNDVFKNHAAGDYTPAAGSPAVDAMNMDLWSTGFGYLYDIRGEGYYRLVNDIADIGAYELQAAKPTFEVTIVSYEGDYDGAAHSVTVSGLAEGDAVYYSEDGANYVTDPIAYTDPGAYTTYVKVERAGYEDFTGSGTVTINDVTPSEQLAAPTITTGTRGIYVSYGANRHNIQWGAVANASGYEVQYSTDGSSWASVSASGLSAVITGLTYGADVTYRVRALGTGSYTDSDWSRTKTFNVCPMDINGDGDIAGSDRTIMATSWLAEEGEEGYQYYADINGDGEVSNTDRPFIGQNWNKEAGDDDLVYPRALRAADAAFASYEAGDLDVDIDVF